MQLFAQITSPWDNDVSWLTCNQCLPGTLASPLNRQAPLGSAPPPLQFEHAYSVRLPCRRATVTLAQVQPVC